MPYSNLLFRLIEEKGLTDVEVTKRCKENGIQMSESYFNKVKNKRRNPPIPEKSRAIAKALGIDERRLVIEGYVDKAPKEIQEVFRLMLLMENISAIKFLELMDKSLLKEFEEYIINEPVADMIIDILDNGKNYINFIENEMYHETMGNMTINLGLANPIGIEVKDNAMSPIINKGDKVTFQIIENTAKSTDMLLVKTKANPEVRIRNVVKINSTRQLQGCNPECKIEICDKDDLTIIGRVNNVIKKI